MKVYSTFIPGSLVFKSLQKIGTGTETSPLLPFAPSVEYRAGKLHPYACIRPSDIPSREKSRSRILERILNREDTSYTLRRI